MNELLYQFALFIDASSWSTALHESFYLYNWIESAHVISLAISLGLLFLIDLRLLGYAFTDVLHQRLIDSLMRPMFVGFVVTFATGILLYYAIPVRTTQSVWFRLKLLFLVFAAINALVAHVKLNRLDKTSNAQLSKPIRRAAMTSLALWLGIVVFGRLIAYDWYDCVKQPEGLMAVIAGCLSDQAVY